MNIIKPIFKTLRTPQAKLILLAIIASLLWIFVSLTAAFFWSVFLIFALFSIDSTIVAQAALICLVSLPFLLAVDKEGTAEQIAVYAFYLLSITVFLQMIELKRSPEAPAPKKIRRLIMDIIPSESRIGKRLAEEKKRRFINRDVL